MLFLSKWEYMLVLILRSIYFAIAYSCLPYCTPVWAQNSATIQKIVIKFLMIYQYQFLIPGFVFTLSHVPNELEFL